MGVGRSNQNTFICIKTIYLIKKMFLYLSLAVTLRCKPREGICSVIPFVNSSDSVTSIAFLFGPYIVLNSDFPP